MASILGHTRDGLGRGNDCPGPALAFGVCDVVCPSDGCVDHHAPHVDYGAFDLHEGVKLGFKEALSTVLDVRAVANYTDASCVPVRDSPSEEFLGIRDVVEMLLGNVVYAEELVGAAGEASADCSQLLKRGHVAASAFHKLKP